LKLFSLYRCSARRVAKQDIKTMTSTVHSAAASLPAPVMSHQPSQVNSILICICLCIFYVDTGQISSRCKKTVLCTFAGRMKQLN